VLSQTVARGWGFEDGEVQDGYRSVAAAAHDHAGRPAAAVTVTGRADRLTDPEGVAQAVTACATVLTARLRR
jgi:DNA-binding IclR family transcriptional regulator